MIAVFCGCLGDKDCLECGGTGTLRFKDKPAEPPPEVPCTHANQALDEDGEWHCLSCEPPEVPAPDEVWVIIGSEAVPYDVYGDKTNAEDCAKHCGGTVVRYVRADR